MRIWYTTALFFKQQILPAIQSKWRHRLAFGCEALSLRPIDSLKENARLVSGNVRKTAETRMYRVSHTMKFVSWFPTLLSKLKLVNQSDVINIDFSDFSGRQVLMFSKQTGQGRAIPVYFEFLKYPIAKGSQNLFIMAVIARFLKALGHRTVHLVCDRGFMIPVLVRFLVAENITFTIRIKAGKQVVAQGAKKSVTKLKKRDSLVQVYGQTLRVVRSKKQPDNKEPWYLLTNDVALTADQVITRYYHRFEIEEFFKDAKRLSEAEYFLHMKDITFTTTLWFLILGYWIAWLCKRVRAAWDRFVTLATPYHEKRCLLRWFFEVLQQEQYQLLKQRLKIRFEEV